MKLRPYNQNPFNDTQQHKCISINSSQLRVRVATYVQQQQFYQLHWYLRLKSAQCSRQGSFLPWSHFHIQLLSSQRVLHWPCVPLSYQFQSYLFQSLGNNACFFPFGNSLHNTQNILFSFHQSGAICTFLFTTPETSVFP